MTKTPKRPRDPNQLAKLVVEISTGNAQDDASESTAETGAAKLGRLGGLRGGRARAEKLTPRERSDIARAAAAARWSRDQSEEEK